MNSDTLLENFAILAEAPGGISQLRLLIVELAIHGMLSNSEKLGDSGYPSNWNTSPASEFFKSRSGNSKLIKGTLFNDFAEGRYPGYSASGQDVWLESAEHSGEAAILSAVGARCGKAFRASGSWSAIANTHIIWLNDNRVEPDYGMLILNNEKFWIRSGSAQPFVKVRASLEQIIGIPPLPEQKRIVEAVDQLREFCDNLEKMQQNRDSIRVATRKSVIDVISTATTQEELETAWKRINNNWDVIADTRESIKALRSLVLNLATSGRLVPPMKEGTSSIETLLKKIEQNREARLKLKPRRLEDPVPFEVESIQVPSNWRWLRMQDVFEFIDYRGKTPSKKPVGIPLITAKNVRVGFISREPREYIAKSEYPNWMTRGIPKVGDILFTTEAPMGNSAVVDITEQFALAQRVICLSPYSDLNSRFLVSVMNSPWFQNKLSQISSGMTATGVKASRLKLVTIPIPPLKDQERIVNKIDELMALCDQLEAGLMARSELAEKFARSVVSAS